MRGILLVNLGSPKEPTIPAIRKYLSEFLMDPYVLQMPSPLRAMLVYGIILPFRPKKTLKNYLKIWTNEGSPLIVESIKLKNKLQKHFYNKDSDMHVEVAMRYGDPSFTQALDVFRSKNIRDVRVIPLYPQYAMSSTGTVEAKLKDLNTKDFNQFFNFSFVKDFFNDKKFINPLIETTKMHLTNADYDHLLISFHGLPKSHLGEKVESSVCKFEASCCEAISEKNRYCYRAQCYETARLLTQGLNLSKDKWSVSFQSRLTRGWIEPFTDQIIENMSKNGIKNLAVVCPSFVSDCLETLEEIKIGEKERFLQAGGEKFYYIPCVNDSDSWVTALGEL
ncbi:MAG: ferrochelatase [Bdellovibrionota bacterium]